MVVKIENHLKNTQNLQKSGIIWVSEKNFPIKFGIIWVIERHLEDTHDNAKNVVFFFSF